MGNLGVGESRACHVLGQARSTQRYRPRVRDDEDRLAKRIVELAGEYGRYGYGAVARKGSIALIERFWRSMKTECVNDLFPYRSQVAIETRLRRYACWYNRERPHRGLANRTPDEVHRRRSGRVPQRLTTGTLSVRFLDGDHRLPILRLTRAA